MSSIQFKVVPAEVRNALPNVRSKSGRVLSPLAVALAKGETVFIADTSPQSSSRLGQYYEVARNHGKKFTMRKTELEGVEGFLCWFRDSDEEGTN
jgi:hypothetical protein